MLLLPTSRPARRVGYWLWLRVVLVVVAVAQRRLGPSSSATTSTVERALPSSAVHARCWSRPTITTRLPLESDCVACSAWSRQTITVKNDASCSLRPDTALRDRLDVLYGAARPTPEGTVVRLRGQPGRGPSVAPGGPGNDESAADDAPATL
jgi:hypothetical protein